MKRKLITDPLCLSPSFFDSRVSLSRAFHALVERYWRRLCSFRFYSRHRRLPPRRPRHHFLPDRASHCIVRELLREFASPHRCNFFVSWWEDFVIQGVAPVEHRHLRLVHSYCSHPRLVAIGTRLSKFQPRDCQCSPPLNK